MLELLVKFVDEKKIFQRVRKSTLERVTGMLL